MNHSDVLLALCLIQLDDLEKDAIPIGVHCCDEFDSANDIKHHYESCVCVWTHNVEWTVCGACEMVCGAIPTFQEWKCLCVVIINMHCKTSCEWNDS